MVVVVVARGPTPPTRTPTYAAGSAGGGNGAAGTAGTITLTWNVDVLSVTNPGTQTSVSGSAISNLTISSSYDTTGGNSVTYSATGLPAGLSISVGRRGERYAHDGVRLLGHRDGHGLPGPDGHDVASPGTSPTR